MIYGNKSAILIVNELHFYYFCRYIVRNKLFETMKTVLLYFLCCFIIGCTNESTKRSKNNEAAGTDIPDCRGMAELIDVYSLGTTIRMQTLQRYYTVKSNEIFAVVLNPQNFSLSCGRYWILEKWENGQWIKPKMKENIFFFDDEILLPACDFLCFRFPISYYDITIGKYRISISLWNNGEEIKLNTEFEIK